MKKLYMAAALALSACGQHIAIPCEPQCDPTLWQCECYGADSPADMVSQPEDGREPNSETDPEGYAKWKEARK